MSDEGNLTRDEARERSGLVSDVHYEITLDLTGSETFDSDSLVRFRFRVHKRQRLLLPNGIAVWQSGEDQIVEQRTDGAMER